MPRRAAPRRAYLCVNKERQHQHRQQQVRERQADNEVVGGGFQSLLQVHAEAHEHVPTRDDHDQQNPEYQRREVVVSGRRAALRAVVGGDVRHGAEG